MHREYPPQTHLLHRLIRQVFADKASEVWIWGTETALTGENDIASEFANTRFAPEYAVVDAGTPNDGALDRPRFGRPE